MARVQRQVVYNRLKTALKQSEGQATTLFNAHTVEDWMKVIEYAVKQGDNNVVEFLLKSDAVRNKVVEQDALFLGLACRRATPNIVTQLMNIPEFRTKIFASLSTRVYVIFRDAHLSVIQYFMTLDEVKNYAITYSSNILKYAINRGDLAIFKYLFLNEDLLVEDNNVYALLECAILSSTCLIFEFLLEFGELRNIAHDRSNTLLKLAIKKNDINKVNLLLNIPLVLNRVKTDKRIMRDVISSNRDEIIERFVAIPELKSTLNYEHLICGIFNGNAKTVKYLLSINKIVKEITSENHRILRTASFKIVTDILVMLLEKYPNRSIPLDVFARIYHGAPNSNIRTKLFDRPLTLSAKCVDKKKIDAIKAWAEHWGLGEYPLSFEIDSVRWSDYLYNQMLQSKTPKSAAIIILSLQEMAAEHAKNLLPELPLDIDESAMDKSLVNKSAKHFKEHIEPYYKEKFETFGGVEGIERRIKEVILDKLIANKPDIAEAIAHMKGALLNGDEEAMRWMFLHCQDTTDIYETSWRAYDPEAPVEAFANLLTAPTTESENDPLYSIPETGVSENFGLKMGSDIIRTRACYFFLVATDERMTPEQWEISLEKFIAAVAELRRSNNDDEDEQTDADSPSCFPGCITHLGKIATVNPYIPPMDFMLHEDMQAFFRSEFRKILVSLFLKCTNKASVAQLVEALTMLTHETAWDIIKKPWKVDCPSLATGPDDDDEHPYDATLLAKRIALMRQYFNPHNMLKAYDRQKPAYAKVSITQHERVLLQDSMVDPGRGDVAQLIISCANTRTLTLDRLEQAQQAVGNITNITGNRRSFEEVHHANASDDNVQHIDKKTKYQHNG